VNVVKNIINIAPLDKYKAATMLKSLDKDEEILELSKYTWY